MSNVISLEKLLELDYTEIWPFIVDTLRNAGNNPRAFALIIGLFSIITLLIVLVIVLVFMSGSDDEDEYETEDGTVVEYVPAPAAVRPVASEQAVEEEPGSRRLKRALISFAWGAAFLAVLVAGGIVTRQDTMCLTCHQKALVHQQRLMKASTDPHKSVKCVECHESANLVVSVTAAVPARAWHFGGAVMSGSFARGYGTPVANAACESCHKAEIIGTLVNKDRGIRISHKEPLEAKALCTDCHALRPNTGVVDRYTVGMDPCLRCHDGKRLSTECTYCHTRDVGYAAASRQVVEAKAHTTVLDCGGCHDQRTCDACHGMRMPHSRSFKFGGHARTAVEDIWFNGGKTCSRCHSATRRPCSKCHTGQFPSHGTSFAKSHQTIDPINNGCDNCHGYNEWLHGRNFCQNCHPRIFERQKQ